MAYRAVGDRCAIDLSALDHTLPNGAAVSCIAGRGFRILDVDLAAIAERMVGRATYRRGARMSDAPAAFDCSSFVKWLYAARGVWLPRYSPHQFLSGVRVEDGEIAPGDLAFQAGQTRSPCAVNPEGVGHVGIVCSSRTIVHATRGATGGVSRALLDDWIADPSFRGARRVIPAGHVVLTLQIPPSLEIETSDDILWAILETLDWEES